MKRGVFTSCSAHGIRARKESGGKRERERKGNRHTCVDSRSTTVVVQTHSGVISFSLSLLLLTLFGSEHANNVTRHSCLLLAPSRELCEREKEGEKTCERLLCVTVAGYTQFDLFLLYLMPLSPLSLIFAPARVSRDTIVHVSTVND